jgi:hypothetical protein
VSRRRAGVPHALVRPSDPMNGGAIPCERRREVDQHDALDRASRMGCHRRLIGRNAGRLQERERGRGRGVLRCRVTRSHREADATPCSERRRLRCVLPPLVAQHPHAHATAVRVLLRHVAGCGGRRGEGPGAARELASRGFMRIVKQPAHSTDSRAPRVFDHNAAVSSAVKAWTASGRPSYRAGVFW